MDVNQYTEQYFKFLTEHYLASITAQINHKVLDNIAVAINQYDIKTEIDRQINATVANGINAFRSANLYGAEAVGENIVQGYKQTSAEYVTTITNEIKTRVFEEFKAKLQNIDVVALIKDHASQVIQDSLARSELTFLPNSIPASAVRSDELKIRAENIIPGIISKFSSSGIEDLSNSCQVTLTDQFTILENTLVTQDIQVKGQLKLDGSIDSKLTNHIAQLAVDKIEQTYSDGTFDQYVHRVYNKITTEGLDAGHIKVQGRPIVEANSLALTITQSNLRKVGLLVELEVGGEALLDDTLYVRSGKVGVNTTEPQYTLDIWDQEVQLIAAKRERDALFFGTVKPQKIVFGSNSRDQLILHPNGNITVDKMTIGFVTHASAAFQPTDNRQLGEIVWNEQPQIGRPIGWVSLGGARWAQFGTITE